MDSSDCEFNWKQFLVLTQSVLVRVVHPFTDPEDGDTGGIFCLFCEHINKQQVLEWKEQSSCSVESGEEWRGVAWPQLSPCRITAFSEGLAARIPLSCCSMSFRWHSEGSASLHNRGKMTDTSERRQIFCLSNERRNLWRSADLPRLSPLLKLVLRFYFVHTC